MFSTKITITNMYTKTIKTPLRVNLAFLFLLILPLLVMYWIGKASAATVRDFRTVQCQNAFIGYEYNPKLETQCRWKWNFWTRNIKKSYNQK